MDLRSEAVRVVRRSPAAVVLVLALVLSGCSGGTAGTAAPAPASAAAAQPVPKTAAAPTQAVEGAGVTGLWNGSFTSKDGSGGTFRINYRQAGSAVEGTITATSTCIPSGTITGTVTGSAITVTLMSPTGSAITLDGTVSGNTMSGSYAADSSCRSDTGTWEAGR